MTKAKDEIRREERQVPLIGQLVGHLLIEPYLRHTKYDLELAHDVTLWLPCQGAPDAGQIARVLQFGDRLRLLGLPLNDCWGYVAWSKPGYWYENILADGPGLVDINARLRKLRSMLLIRQRKQRSQGRRYHQLARLLGDLP